MSIDIIPGHLTDVNFRPEHTTVIYQTTYDAGISGRTIIITDGYDERERQLIEHAVTAALTEKESKAFFGGNLPRIHPQFANRNRKGKA